MFKKKSGKSTTIVPALSILLFLTHIMVLQAEEPQKRAMPDIQLLLLSNPQPNIAFVTSVSYDGNLGGLEEADQLCQSLATTAGLPQNTYRAWLSSSSADAVDRLGTARGWVRADGKPFADTRADLVAGKIYHPLRVNENGNFDDQLWGTCVWTGTSPDGTLSPGNDTCNDWTSSANDVWGAYGNDNGVTEIYTTRGSSLCNTICRLYCFGVDRNVPVTVTPVVGRLAFHTRDPWTPSGGIASADQLCMTEATAAGLGGNFKALLATSTASAASRFDSSGPPWVRPDGVAIAPTAADLFSADFLDTAISQSADGLQYFGNYRVWAGAFFPDGTGTAGTTCSDWTSSSAAEIGRTGTSGFTYRINFFGQYENTCSATSVRLYCLQE